uniref:Ribonuclease A-domain domain-containing protein n=1 Tax=Astyanax mexicanus TaxID=7994 RepID=A0A3B1IQ38_ASTMX
MEWCVLGIMNPSILVLLLVLCTVLPTDGQDFQKFKAKHVKTANEMCTEEMKKINNSPELKVEKQKCKKKNTFILDTIDNIETVCNITAYHKNYHKSNNTFTIVDCTAEDINGDPCKYTGEKKNNAAIYIACDQNKLPVHYGKPKNNKGKLNIFT